MARLRRSSAEPLNAWPGYVDALSTLLMVIIFVLLVFVLAQAFLSVALSGRDRALDKLNQQVAQLSDMLSTEKSRSSDLRSSIDRLHRDLQAATAERLSLTDQLASLRTEASRVTTDRDALRGERDRLTSQLAQAAQRGDAAGQQAAAAAVELAHAKDELAVARDMLAELRRQAEAADKTVQTDRATLDARLSDLARLQQQVQALTALRDQLEQQAQEAAVRATTEQQRREPVAAELADQQKLADSERAQLALATQQVTALRDDIASVKAALDASEAQARDKDVQIANLGQRLNVALAQKVEELQRYRSEFFGRLRDVLANRPGIQVVGDRFVFQSEVLFPPGGAELNQAGQDEIAKLAATLKDIAGKIPPDVNWILRVDGHADRQPLGSGTDFDNWDLSAKRAIGVVHRLIADGVPANRLAATAFADNQPIDPGITPDAYAKNRRIEIRLTDR